VACLPRAKRVNGRTGFVCDTTEGGGIDGDDDSGACSCWRGGADMNRSAAVPTGAPMATPPPPAVANAAVVTFDVAEGQRTEFMEQAQALAAAV
jgi:hypothetical protein